MVGFEVLLENFKEKCDSSIFKFDSKDKIYKENLFNHILFKYSENCKINSEESLKENVSLLSIIFQLYPTSDISIERLLSKKVTLAFRELMDLFFGEEYRRINRQILFKNIYILADIFFHNPDFVEYIDENEQKLFLSYLVKMTEIEYDVDSDDEIILALEYSVSIIFYFSSDKYEKYIEKYLNHFDTRIVEEIKDLI